eukprot:snap_masked-scaffold_31-processed-gene-2.34-mRNA-1 protein AED:1.00 eAED:1.00 QI:0/0/0/0/1/1/2/0/109
MECKKRATAQRGQTSIFTSANTQGLGLFKKKGGGLTFIFQENKFKNIYFKKTSLRIYISKKKVQGFYISKEKGSRIYISKKKGGGFGFKGLCSRFMFKKSKVCKVKDLC